MARRGELDQVARGLYRVPGHPVTEHVSTTAVLKRVPGAVLCLLSALHFHNIGTQQPHAVWIALGRKARKPRITDVPVRSVRFSDQALTYGVQTVEVDGLPIRVTSVARTVVDCFRYRHKIGLDVALEALKDAVGRRLATPAEIERVAAACRARTVMRPYLEMVSA